MPSEVAMKSGEAARKGDDLDSILSRVERSLESNEVPAEVYRNDTLFREEMRQIFARNWVFVAHESEIPNKNDFVLRRIGLDEVIVTRDSIGKVSVLSNHCTHRGAKLCAADSGNASRFRCPYHGWTYKNTGDWVGAPHMGEAYGGRLDAQRWALLKAPKIGVHQGFIFAALAEDAPSFEDYLAGAGWLLNMVTGIAPRGMRVAAPPERYRVNADWKSGAENFSGDVYHIDVAHFSTELSGVASDMASGMKNTWRLDLGSGHSFLCQSLGEWYGPGADFWGYSEEHRARFDLTSLDPCQQALLSSRPPTVGNIFPNLRYIRFPFSLTPGGTDFRVFTSFAQWQPIAPGVMEIWNWMFVWDFETEQEARDSYEIGQRTFGSAGFFEQDDVVVWEGSAAAAGSPWRQDAGVTYHYHTGATDRFVDPAPEFEWTGPGRLEKNAYNEAFMLSFWRQWLELMKGREGVTAAKTETPLQETL
jgi:nitrite reductase/ring-hydroxylating ferredoxin subunit